MSQWTQAERYLLEQIRLGSQEGWSQLVDRYQGRLLAFARRRIPRGADPEDLVQDTFIKFLRGLPEFREQASIETYLFLILRRRIIEAMRGRKAGVCQLPDGSEPGEMQDAGIASDQTASRYALRDEQRVKSRDALAGAIRGLVGSLQTELNFRELQVLEMLFYAQWPNRSIAQALGIDPAHVGMVKHRWLKQLRQSVGMAMPGAKAEDLPTTDVLDSLLTEIWEDQRPSCPKRSTIGGYLLKTLDEPWQQYAAFHLDVLGCSFCRANLDDLRKQTQQDPRALRTRILQSTVGFLRKTS